MSESAPIPELTSYDGNCHCGAVAFTLKIPSLEDHKVMACNCSQCTRNGYLNIYPERKDVVFHSGYDNLSSYPVLGANIHKFCSTCGSSIVAEAINEPKDDEKDCIAINVRMIKDIDVDKLKLQYYDGRAAKPEYDVGKGTTDSDSSTALATDSGLTPYYANCHCGAVRYTVRIPSLTDHKVNSCNCSVCTRNGYLLVYPEREQVTFHTGYDHLHPYIFGTKRKTHKFCPTCGSSILIDFNGIYEGSDELAINVRMLQDADPTKFKYKYFDGKTKLKPEYTI